MKRIGIIGGMGAMAGARFYETLVRMCQEHGATKDTDFPETILYSLATDAMDNTGIVNGVKFEEELIRTIGTLRDGLRCDRVLIACNTAYVYQDNYRHLFHDLVISLPESAIRACNGKPYGVICSRTTRDKKLYGDVPYCNDDEQLRVDKVIQKVIEGKQDAEETLTIEDIVNRIRLAGCERVILGCTELPEAYHGTDIIDPSRTAIAEALA